MLIQLFDIVRHCEATIYVYGNRAHIINVLVKIKGEFSKSALKTEPQKNLIL